MLLQCVKTTPISQSTLVPDGCQHDAKSFKCVVFLSNYDADTITVRIPNVHQLFGESISVRVRGIDSAERRSKDNCETSAAQEAKLLVGETLTKARRIDLTDVGRDKYFRILANVEADGKSIAEILRSNRLAVNYDGGTKQRINWCTFKATKPKSPDNLR